MAAPIFDSSDISKNKLTGGLGYILPFVPYLTCKDSAFGRYCANQGLILWLCFLIVWVAFGILGALLGRIPLIGDVVYIANQLCKLAIGAFMLYATFIATTSGRATEVPVVGTLNLLK